MYSFYFRVISFSRFQARYKAGEMKKNPLLSRSMTQADFQTIIHFMDVGMGCSLISESSDFAGNIRIRNGRIDIGANEVQIQISLNVFNANNFDINVSQSN